MSAKLTSLIDKQDTFEIVRDQIAAILTVEIAEQQVLAAAAGEDPALWTLRVFAEANNPWDQFGDDSVPIVNVWYDSTDFPENDGDVIERQGAVGVFNVDCYGVAASEDNPSGGHLPGDRGAAFAAHRALRLVRNILMSGSYVYLGLQGTVGQRWPQSVQIYQPEFNSVPVYNVIGARLALQVRFDEYSPQVETQTLDLLSVDVLRAEDGEIVLEADYDYTV